MESRFWSCDEVFEMKLLLALAVCSVLTVWTALAAQPLNEVQLEAAVGGKLALWLDASNDSTLQEYRYNGHAVPASPFNGGKVVRRWNDRRTVQTRCYAINGRSEVTGRSNAGFVRVMPYTITNALNGRSVMSFGVRGRTVTGFQNRIATDGTAMSETAEEGRRLLFNSPLSCATAVMVFGSQDGGGYAMLGGLAKATGENMFLASGETCDISTSAAPMWRDVAAPSAMPILNSSALPMRVDGFEVDSTTAGFSGGYQIISFSVPSGANPMTVRSLGMKDVYGNAGGQRYGEVLVFSNRLETAEVKLVERYLASKWGLESTYGVRREPSFSICCVGDSITEGSSSFVCHRVALEAKLAAEGWNVTWRGSHVTTSSGSAQLHEGWGGKTAEQVAAIYESNAVMDKADVLLIHAGHNHFVDEQPIAGIIAAHRRIIAAARAQNPDVLIFDAQVITSGKLPKYSYIPDLNLEIAKLAQELSTARSPVVAVNMAEGWDWTVDTVSDMVHPTAVGAQKMAAKWFAALASSPIRRAHFLRVFIR